MVVSEDCHGTALHKGLEIAHGSELRTVHIFTSAFASNTTTDYVNSIIRIRLGVIDSNRNVIFRSVKQSTGAMTHYSLLYCIIQKPGISKSNGNYSKQF